MTTIRIACVIIVYKPDLLNLKQNIQRLLGAVDDIIIWQNSSENLSHLKMLSNKIQIWGNGTNQYISYPLNSVLDWCFKNRIDYVLTMDQDSTWEDCIGFIRTALSISDKTVGIYAPSINNIEPHQDEFKEIDYTITSGSLVDVEIAKQIGGFNNKYKIYWVDGEFCFKLRNHGFKILKLMNYRLIHHLGNPTKTLFGFETSNYAPIVYYFIVRNMIWEHRQYGSSAVSYKCILYTLFFNVRGIVLGENNKLLKIWKILTGLYHGLLFSYK